MSQRADAGRADAGRAVRARHALYWLGALAVVVGLLALLRDILLPFVAGLVIAYCLDPFVLALERRGLSRNRAATIVVGVGGLIAGLLLVILLPLLIDQLRSLAENLPGILESLRLLLDRLAGSVLPGGPEATKELLERIFGELSSSGGTALTGILSSVLSGGLVLVNFLSLLLITPVVAFYILLDWDDLVARIDSWLPRDHAATIRRLAGEVDEVISGFLRGQALVCLILGLIYAAGLSWVGLDYALLVGLGAGVLSFVPFVGTLTGLVIGTTMAVAQFGSDWVSILLVLATFAFGQALEGNLLSPRIVGQSVRLHPVWLIFALFVFGYLFGFVGMLVAVPVAAAIGVLVRFTLAEYLESSLYLGCSASGEEPAARLPQSDPQSDPQADGAQEASAKPVGPGRSRIRQQGKRRR